MLLVALIAFVLGTLLASGLICAARAIGGLRAMPRRARLEALALATLVLALAVASFALSPVPLHHVMYVDEPWYLEVGRRLASTGRAELCSQGWEGQTCIDYPKAYGWPVVLALLHAIGSLDDATALALTSLLGALGVALAAIVALAAGGRRASSVATALLLATQPVYLEWSATAETNVPAQVALLAGLAGALGYLRRERLGLGVLAASGLTFAAAIRPESALVIVPCIVMVLHSRPRGYLFITALLVSGAVLSALAAVPLWVLNREITGDLSPASISYIPDNLGRLLREHSHILPSLSVLTVLGTAGGIGLTRSGGGAPAFVLTSSAILLGLVGLSWPFFASRLLLGSVVCLAVLGGHAGEVLEQVPLLRRSHAPAIASIVGAVSAALTLGPALERIAHVPDTQHLETRLPALAAATIPDGATVIIEHPTVLAASTDIEAMSSREALSRGDAALAQLSSEREVFFVCDMFCEPGHGGRANHCPPFLERFELEEVAAIERGQRRYAILRLRRIRAPGSPPAQCPFRTAPSSN